MIAKNLVADNAVVGTIERRRYRRVALAIQVEFRLQSGDVPLRTRTTDISLGGCYVEMPFTLEVGSQVDIVLWVGAQKVKATGVVVTSHSQFGNGVKFTSMSPEAMDLLERYLNKMEDEQTVEQPM